ncbi:MAG: hypothetical protein ACRDBG_25535 [Waterburya sp.]
MSVIRNITGALGQFVPVRERREASGTLGAVNAELVIDTNGDESALVYIQSTAFIGTLEFTAASNNDSTQFFPIATYPYAIGCVGGTIPLAAEPIISDALVAANIARVYSIPCGQVKKLRVRVSAFTSGSCVCSIVTDTQRMLNTAVLARPATRMITNTGVASAAVTATLPAVAGLRHIVDFVKVTRSATVALTASATPLLITTTNLPGSPVITMGQDAAQIGVDKEVTLDFGSSGLAATTINTPTTIVAPIATGSIWRINVAYRLGL